MCERKRDRNTLETLRPCHGWAVHASMSTHPSGGIVGAGAPVPIYCSTRVCSTIWDRPCQLVGVCVWRHCELLCVGAMHMDHKHVMPDALSRRTEFRVCSDRFFASWQKYCTRTRLRLVHKGVWSSHTAAARTLQCLSDSVWVAAVKSAYYVTVRVFTGVFTQVWTVAHANTHIQSSYMLYPLRGIRHCTCQLGIR